TSSLRRWPRYRFVTGTAWCEPQLTSRRWSPGCATPPASTEAVEQPADDKRDVVGGQVGQGGRQEAAGAQPQICEHRTGERRGQDVPGHDEDESHGRRLELLHRAV